MAQRFLRNVRETNEGKAMATIARWLGGAALAFALAAPAGAEVAEVRITKQTSIIYLPLVVIKVQWITFNSGGAATDALLSGNVDLVTSGVSNLLLLWERTKGEINGV